MAGRRRRQGTSRQWASSQLAPTPTSATSGTESCATPAISLGSWSRIRSTSAWLREAGVKSKLILQVHDELVLEVPDDEVTLIRDQLPRLMAGVAQLSVPLVAEVGVGINWDEAH